jgi:hypothetical protein
MPVLLETGQIFTTAAAAADTSAGSGLRVRALCAYEGKFTSGNGVAKTFTKKLLQAMVTASNEHLKSGVPTPLFISNHDYTQNHKVGTIEGPFEGQVITESDLPHPDLKDLIGKFGIFTTVRLVKEEAIEDYNLGLLKAISMGVDFSGQLFPKNAIYEISFPGFSAIPGAQLFNFGGEGMQLDFAAMAQEAIQLAEGGVFALTLKDKMAQQNLMPKLYGLFDAFTSVIRDIIDSDRDDEEKDDLIQQAISDLAVGFTSKLRVSDLAQMSGVSSGDNSPEGSETVDDFDDLEDEDMATNAELEQQVFALQQQVQMQGLYAQVQGKAAELFAAKKLTPAQYQQFQAPSTAIDAITATFAASTKAPADAIAELNKRMVQLETIEQFGQPIAPKFGSHLDDEPLPTMRRDPKDLEPDAAAFLGQYSIRSPLFGTIGALDNVHKSA